MNDLQQSKQLVLVTGAMGFSGSFVIGKLIQSGYRVRAMTRNNPIADRKNTEHYDRGGIYTVIRFPFIFDRHPAFSNSMLGEIIEKAKTGVNFEFPFQNGFKYGTSWISGNDAADAIVISLGKSSGGIFNVASGYIEWQDLVNEVVKETGNQSRVNHSGPDISPQSIFNTRRELGTSKFSEILHFKPKDTFRSTVMRILNGKQP